jgi:predicted naringenin-chalcone synthase
LWPSAPARIVPAVSDVALSPTLRRRRAERREGSARIAGLALSTPSSSFTQDELLDLLGLADDPFAAGIFARSGVRKRHLEVSAEILSSTLQERTAATEEGLFRLALQAIDELRFDPCEIGVVVSATYYSLGGPTLAHRIVDHYGLDPGTDKYHLVGVGCASAVPLFRVAAGCLGDRPQSKALVVAAESISGFLTGVAPEDEKVKVVGSALFGDGCAAALISPGGGDGPGPTIVATAVHQVAGTLSHVRFGVTGDDSHMQISRELPALAEATVRPLAEDFVRGQGLELADVDEWLVHPGGRRIIEGLQAALGLTDEQVAPSFKVLSEFGNVGTPAGLFVLGATVEDRRPAPGDHGLMITVGPGVTIGFMLLRW